MDADGTEGGSEALGCVSEGLIGAWGMESVGKLPTVVRIPNPEPQTLNPKPSTLHPQPCTLNPQPLTLTHKPQILEQVQSCLGGLMTYLREFKLDQVLSLTSNFWRFTSASHM